MTNTMLYTYYAVKTEHLRRVLHFYSKGQPLFSVTFFWARVPSWAFGRRRGDRRTRRGPWVLLPDMLPFNLSGYM